MKEHNESRMMKGLLSCSVQHHLLGLYTLKSTSLPTFPIRCLSIYSFLHTPKGSNSSMTRTKLSNLGYAFPSSDGVNGCALAQWGRPLYRMAIDSKALKYSRYGAGNPYGLEIRWDQLSQTAAKERRQYLY